jgi:hypothetical protein
MGGGNAQKSASARAKKLEKDAKKGAGSQLKTNAAAQNVVVCSLLINCLPASAALKTVSLSLSSCVVD